MWRILQQDEPGDYVLATGEAHTVREFIERAFSIVGLKIAWRGKGVNEIGLDPRTGTVLVQVDPSYFRPTEVDLLLGNPAKAELKLGWSHNVTFEQLVEEMVLSDLSLLRQSVSSTENAGQTQALLVG
jgi:GDPmannose 4,6-dehydratase